MLAQMHNLKRYLTDHHKLTSPKGSFLQDRTETVCSLLKRMEKDRNFVQLCLYHDEFETANPLHSKANINKLGGLYMSIRNLYMSIRNFPQYITSQSKNIFPLT